MTEQKKDVVFTNMNDYRRYYAADDEPLQADKDDYYQIGVNIAKVACKKAIEELGQQQSNRHLANFKPASK